MPTRISRLFPALFFLLFLGQAPVWSAQTETNGVQATVQALLHSLDYIAVDYSGAVKDGEISDAGEYSEQREFAAQMLEQLARLPQTAQSPDLQNRLIQIRDAIETRRPDDEVAALCHEAAKGLIATYGVSIAPRKAPPLTLGARLYQQLCAQCHGSDGRGDGPQAAGLEPPPVDFHNPERQDLRNVYSLYTTITLGVKGTAMPSFVQLNEEQRWALAFTASNFLASNEERRHGEQIWRQRGGLGLITHLEQLTLLTPTAARTQASVDGESLLAFLRAKPEHLTPQGKDAVRLSRQKLAVSMQAYRDNDHEQAYELAMSAYLDGFELAEGQLKTVAPKLRKQVEESMSSYRQLLKADRPVAEVEAQYQIILTQLDEAQSVLAEAGESAALTLFSSMLILLREGLEAILVLASIAAFLAKTDQRHHLRYVHMGWIGALVLGVATWLVAQLFIDIDIGGAGRELTEGIAALVAASMLLYVGFWLHRQSNVQQWQQYLHGKLGQQLSSGRLWGLMFIAFLAVYREVLETVLFYQAFWLQSPPEGQRYIVMGFIIAAVLLVAIAWAIFHFSVRLPLRPFFRANAILLFVLSLIYTGKGIAALQEAGYLQKDSVPFVEIDLLGIYPNLESLSIQALILVLAAIWLLRQQRPPASA
ncbi:MAG: c-type cytochrome [Gammaproteobacteria bacterium]|nr:c-type cytochrome [Gammaproteobacteria bacterium]